MKIKICGMQSLTDITYANQAMPDYIGFVFAQSKRRISYETAVTLRKQLHPDILAVGVFVDAQTAEVIRLLEENVIDLAQLHGKETPEDVERIKESTKKPLIKAIREQDIATAKYWATSAVDYLLFDSGAGSGKTFDWSCVGEELRQKPFFLAGGIRVDNVTEAIMRMNPYAIDVSSGAETNDHKDLHKMLELVQLTRAAKPQMRCS